jgi:cellulose synthase operon protein C
MPVIESAGTKIALVCLMAALAAGCGSRSVGDSISSAKQLMAKRDHAAAVIELKSVLQQSPNSGEARYLLGVALLEQGNPSAALLELGKAQHQNFDDELLAPKLARAWLATGKLKEVVQIYALLLPWRMPGSTSGPRQKRRLPMP